MRSGFYSAIALFSLMAAAEAFADAREGLCRTIHFPFPQTSLTPEGLTRVSLPDSTPDTQTGYPVLPVCGITFELPEGAEVVTLTLQPGTFHEISLAAPVEWGQPPRQPAELPAADAAPDPAVYGGATPYPDLSKPRWRTDPTGKGSVLSAQIHPVLFDPVRKVLLAAESITVTVLLRNTAPAAAAAARAPILPSPLEPGPHTYAVISTSNLIFNTPGPWNLQALCDARARSGFIPALVTTEWISDNYPGTNLPTRIRAFVQDAYRNWGLQYLLLAGTFDLLPVHRLSVSFRDFFYDRSAEIPSDALYYGCMDGSFDNNGNGLYGELTDGVNGSDIDLTAEVMVGRFPVSNAVELAHMVRKTLHYESASALALQPQAFVAEKINMGTLVYSDGYMEELRYGGSNYGLTSLGFKTAPFADQLNADLTLYESASNKWDVNTALAYLNQNLATVNHMGHGSDKQCFKISLYNSANRTALSAFTNETHYFAYSQACSCGSFDTPDCFAEQVVTVSNAAFAAVMNAREGWEFLNVVGGYSHRYHRAFWDAALRGNATRFGEINEQSRRMNLHLISSTSGNYWRWVYFELNLFGDPATPFVSAVNPALPVITHTTLPNTYDTQSLYRVSCTIEPIGIFDPDNIFLVWGASESPTALITQRMEQVAGNLFESFIPPQPANSRVDYTLFAFNHAGYVASSPATGTHTFFVTERLTFNIQGSPIGYGTPAPDYGIYYSASGLAAAASAPATVPLDENNRVSNIGFFGTGSAPQSGTNQAVTFQINLSSLLVWLWRRDCRLQILSNIGMSPAQIHWAPQNSVFPVPDAEAERMSNGTVFAFAEWHLDGNRSPEAPALSSPAYGNLTMNAPHTLTACYLPSDLDEDSNGIPDWWEHRYYGGTGQDPDADGDNDGYSLSEEYQDRSSPLSASIFPSPPAITFTPLDETQLRPGPFMIHALITDTHAVSRAVVYWHRRTEAWQSTALLPASNNLFEAQIGAGSAPGDDFEYQIIASDPDGRTSQTDIYYLFLRYPVADTSRFHDLSFVALPTQALVGTYMNLHNTGNADLVWSMQVARVENIIDPSLPCWNRISLGQRWSASTNRFASAPYALHSRLISSNNTTGPAVRATITLPPTVIGADATLSFKYWIHSEPYQRTARAFDAGIVEFSIDNGATFQQLCGPYTHTIYGWSCSPWTNGTPCLAGDGSEGWRTITFDFTKEYPSESGFRGRTMILRFHYGADNNTDNEGWYIDDVVLKPIRSPLWFDNSIEPTYNFTISAGGNKRIFWHNLPSVMDLRGDCMTVFIQSNDPTAPSDSFFWQIKVRDYPLMPRFQAVQSADGDGLVHLTADIADRDGEPLNLAFDWSADHGKTWQQAVFTDMSTAVGSVPTNTLTGQVGGLLSSTNDVPLTNRFEAVWASRAVTPAILVSTQALFRASVTNGFYGKVYTCPAFVVDNAPPRFSEGSLTVSPLSAVGPYALTTNLLFLSWPSAADNPSPVLTYRLLDTQANLLPVVSETNLCSLATATLALSNALDRAHRFEVVAIDPSGNVSLPLTASSLVLNPLNDFDGDTLLNADEETAGTLATDSSSTFEVSLLPSTLSPGTFTLSWNSSRGRLYTVECTPTLLPPAWAPLSGHTDIPGTGDAIAIPISVSQTRSFFRIRVFITP